MFLMELRYIPDQLKGADGKTMHRKKARERKNLNLMNFLQPKGDKAIAILILE
jgi:hypothetical protein